MLGREQALADEPRAPGAVQAPLDLLLVEDDDVDHLILQRALDRIDVVSTLTRVGTLAEAAQVIKERSFDCIILDLYLPDGTGLQFLQRLRNEGTMVPVVVLTGSVSEAVGISALDLGAEDFLVKAELTPKALIRALRYAAERYRVRAELAQANRRLSDMMCRDPLTGLLNRRGLEEALRVECARAQRSGSHVAALFADLDDFKAINDSFGHAIGDLVLTEATHAFCRTLRPGDHLARVGGDEFLILLPEARAAEAARVAQRLLEELRRSPVDLFGMRSEPLHISASVGIAPVPPTVSSVTEILAHCRLALRRSKQGGKDQASLADESCVPADVASLLLQGAFRVARQPFFDLATGQVQDACELLIRPPPGYDGGPDDLFRQARSHDLLTPFDLRCLGTCLGALEAIPGRVHLNVLPSTLLELGAERLYTLLPSGADRSRIVLELSEQQLLGDPAHLRPVLNELRGVGVRVALDDVGFGRSSLEALVMLSPEILKIDRTRVAAAAAAAPWGREALRRLVQVAHTLGAEVIVEGVEIEAERQAALAAGVQVGAGYLFARPELLTDW